MGLWFKVCIPEGTQGKGTFFMKNTGKPAFSRYKSPFLGKKGGF